MIERTDSLIQRRPSSRWPATMHTQMRPVNIVRAETSPVPLPHKHRRGVENEVDDAIDIVWLTTTVVAA